MKKKNLNTENSVVVFALNECVCVFLSPLRCGGHLPICWFMPNGSWGFGFVALVCRAESELVLSRKKRRRNFAKYSRTLNRHWASSGRQVSESSWFLLSLHIYTTNTPLNIRTKLISNLGGKHFGFVITISYLLSLSTEIHASSLLLAVYKCSETLFCFFFLSFIFTKFIHGSNCRSP